MVMLVVGEISTLGQSVNAKDIIVDHVGITMK
jgi:hypothetical protein